MESLPSCLDTPWLGREMESKECPNQHPPHMRIDNRSFIHVLGGGDVDARTLWRQIDQSSSPMTRRCRQARAETRRRQASGRGGCFDGGRIISTHPQGVSSRRSSSYGGLSPAQILSRAGSHPRAQRWATCTSLWRASARSRSIFTIDADLARLQGDEEALKVDACCQDASGVQGHERSNTV